MSDDISHLGDLKPDPKNARRHTPRNVGTIVDAMHEVGAARSVVVDDDGTILAGNATVEAAAEAGIERVRVVDADGEEIVAVRRRGLTPDQKTRLALFDNRSAELADWDPDVLASLADDGVSFEGLFTDDELADLVADANGGGTEGLTDPDDVPEPPEEPVTKRGDMIRLGRHRLMCGDALSPDDIDRLLDGVKPNMVWTDPPYGISIVATSGYVGGGEAYDIPFGGVKNETKVDRAKRLGTIGGSKPFGSKTAVIGTVGAGNIVPATRYAPVIGDESTQTAIDAYNLCAAMGVPVLIFWGANHYSSALPDSACWLVWDKENTGHFADCELAWTNQPTAVRIFRHMWNGLMKASERGERRVHPTQKPVALVEWCFQNYGAEDDAVLDLFAGSGPVILAAERLNRAAYLMEMSEAYCDVVVNRWERFTGQKAERPS